MYPSCWKFIYRLVRLLQGSVTSQSILFISEIQSKAVLKFNLKKKEKNGKS